MSLLIGWAELAELDLRPTCCRVSGLFGLHGEQRLCQEQLL